MTEEPVVTLQDGHVVLEAAFDLIGGLLRDGYWLDVDDDGDRVQIIPPAQKNPPVLEILARKFIHG